MKAFLWGTILFGVLLIAGPGDAEMYHWVDENGVNHYANTPPPQGVTAKSSWAEISYDAAADRAQQEKNKQAAETISREQAVEEPARKAAAVAEEHFNQSKIATLEKNQEALARSILKDNFNFRDQANVLRRRIEDLDREIVGADEKDVQALKEKRRTLWDQLFTRRYVVGQGYEPMEAYQKVSAELSRLKQ